MTEEIEDLVLNNTKYKHQYNIYLILICSLFYMGFI